MPYSKKLPAMKLMRRELMGRKIKRLQQIDFKMHEINVNLRDWWILYGKKTKKNTKKISFITQKKLFQYNYYLMLYKYYISIKYFLSIIEIDSNETHQRF